MNTFQIVALTVLGGLVVRDLVCWKADLSRLPYQLARLVAWAAAGFAVASPDAVQHVAEWFGIGRGADAVLYAIALAFLLAVVYQYGWNVRLERQLTSLVRHVALEQAVRGPVDPPAGTPG